jgi:hypothetical protein
MSISRDKNKIEHNLDISALNNKILDYFEKEKNKIPSLKELLKEIDDTLELNNSCDVKLNLTTLNNLLETKKDIEKKIRLIETDEMKNFYIISTTNLLDEYKSILQTKATVNFIGKREKPNKKKNDIYKEFIKIASKYIKINFEKESKATKTNCKNCSGKNFELDDCMYICVDCGCQQDEIINMTSYRDIDRINISSKYTYERLVHFKDAMDQYQGKQKNIDRRIYDELEREFEIYHLLIGDKNTPKEIRFSKIKKHHIYEFLKELGKEKRNNSEKQFYTKHYENINLIHSEFSGIKPDDISHLEDSLMDDFLILSDLYDKKYKQEEQTDRKSFMNTQHTLYQLLRNRGHKCKKEDFHILKTIDRKEFHDDTFSELFHQLGWVYVPIF